MPPCCFSVPALSLSCGTILWGPPSPSSPLRRFSSSEPSRCWLRQCRTGFMNECKIGGPPSARRGLCLGHPEEGHGCHGPLATHHTARSRPLPWLEGCSQVLQLPVTVSHPVPAGGTAWFGLSRVHLFFSFQRLGNHQPRFRAGSVSSCVTRRPGAHRAGDGACSEAFLGDPAVNVAS